MKISICATDKTLFFVLHINKQMARHSSLKRFSVSRGGSHRRVLGGSSWGDWLGSAHDFIKKNKLISLGLTAVGHPEIGAAAGALGYGCRGGKVGTGAAPLIVGTAGDGAQIVGTAGDGAQIVGTAGDGCGGGNRWISHVKRHHAANPHLSYKEAMKSAKHTYGRC